MENSEGSPINQIITTNDYANKLYLSDFLRGTLIHSAIHELKLPLGSRGLDAGCGIGSHVLLLAKVVRPAGHVTGLDLSPELLNYAREIAQMSGLSEDVSFQEGDVNNLPFDDNCFDWAWSSDCIGYAPARQHTVRPHTALKELIRVVKPGGSIIILMWSSQQLLPGYPRLEARLNATSQGIAPFATGMRPELHFMRTLGVFQKVGLKYTEARTFAGSIYAPLSDNVRNALISLFDMRWGEPQSELTQEDWVEYQRLCRPESPDFILNLPDYYAFFTYSMFSGKVAR